MKSAYRLLCGLGFLACVGAMGVALFVQHVLHYEPCPMCIFQRVGVMGTGLLFLIAALHGPTAAGRWVYAVLTALAATAGGAVSARHVWLQSLPPDQVPACGPTLDYLMDMLPVMEVVRMVMEGDGNCAKIDVQWLGLSMPAWTLVAFVGLGLFALATPVLARMLERKTP